MSFELELADLIARTPNHGLIEYAFASGNIINTYHHGEIDWEPVMRVAVEALGAKQLKRVGAKTQRLMRLHHVHSVMVSMVELPPQARLPLVDADPLATPESFRKLSKRLRDEIENGHLDYLAYVFAYLFLCLQIGEGEIPIVLRRVEKVLSAQVGSSVALAIKERGRQLLPPPGAFRSPSPSCESHMAPICDSHSSETQL